MTTTTLPARLTHPRQAPPIGDGHPMPTTTALDPAGLARQPINQSGAKPQNPNHPGHHRPPDTRARTRTSTSHHNRLDIPRPFMDDTGRHARDHAARAGATIAFGVPRPGRGGDRNGDRARLRRSGGIRRRSVGGNDRQQRRPLRARDRGPRPAAWEATRGGARGALSVPTSPSAGVRPIRRRPSGPSPDRASMLSRTGIARSNTISPFATSRLRRRVGGRAIWVSCERAGWDASALSLLAQLPSVQHLA